MSLHVETLKHARISGPYCDIINSFAISNFDNLDSLAIDARGLPKDDDSFEFMECKPNINLKALKLYGFFLHPEMNKKVLKKYPAIEKLELNEWGNGSSSLNLLKFVSTNCTQLRELLIGSRNDFPTDSNINFSSLQILRVKIISNVENLLQFITRNTSIERLSINVVNQKQITSSFIEQLKQLGHLRHLSFLGNGEVMKAIFELMRKGNSPTGLEVLQLHVLPEASAASSSKIVQFYFPISSTTEILI